MAKSKNEKRKDALFRLERTLKEASEHLKEVQAKKPSAFDTYIGRMSGGDGSKHQEAEILRWTRVITITEQEIENLNRKIYGT